MAANGWTPERRARQAELISNWKPWERSTGPKTPEGKAKSSQNAYKGGGWKLFRTLPKGLEEKVGSWSMTQNEARALSLFRILLGNTKVLILDAPLEGLDNQNKTKRLKEIISQANGRTLVMGMVEPTKMK